MTELNFKRIIGILLSLLLIPFLLIVGFIFFGAIAVIVLTIIGLIILLSFLFYLNKKFKYYMYHIKSKGQQYSETKSEEKFHKKTKKGEEIVIEHVEETVERMEKKNKK